jgi:type I restriction enzyme M protein
MGRTIMLTAETKRRIDACRDILVGKLPLPTDQVELITLALIYKFMDDLDEESVQLGGKRSFFTGSLERYRWRSLLPQTVSADTRLTLFADGIEALGSTDRAAHLPALFRDIFRNAFLKFRDGRILTLFLNEVNGFAYSHSEELGNAFEYLLQCMGTQGENGQFRTPRHIIDFIVACLDPKPGETILDPACGTGGFLVSAYKHILAKHTSPQSSIQGDKLTHAQRQKVYGSVTGYDITDLMVKLSKVNLFLHGFPDPGIHIYDTLSNDARWNEKADLILANPPFMTPKGGVTPHTKFRIPAKKAEVLFTDYIAEHLSADGRAGIIVPNGIVATTQTAYAKLRRFLVEDSLVAVVSLPSGVFNPYSGVKTSVLLLDRKLARQREDILFVKVSSDGFDLGAQRRPVKENQLPAAERVVREWLSRDIIARDEAPLPLIRVSRKEILENKDATLVAERFLGVSEATPTLYPMVRLDDASLFKLESGGTPSTSNPAYWNGPHAWATLVDLPAEDVVTSITRTERTITDAGLRDSSAVLLPIGAVVVSTRATLGRVGIARVPLATNQGFKSIIISDGNRAVPEYLAIAVTRLRSAMEEFASGGTFKEISKTNFGHLEIPLPPLEEQRRIVAEIEGYQEILGGARQILEAYSPHFAIDPSWPSARLGDVCETSSGGTPLTSRRDYYHGGTIPWLKSGEVAKGYIYQVDEFITELGLRNSSAKLFPTDTVLVAMYGATAGQVGLLKVPSTTNQAVCGVLPNERVLPEFLYYQLRARTEEMKSLAGGGAQPNISQQIIRSLEIVLPPLSEQQRLVAELTAEAEQMGAVRSLLPVFQAKIVAVLNRVWKQC